MEPGFLMQQRTQQAFLVKYASGGSLIRLSARLTEQRGGRLCRLEKATCGGGGKSAGGGSCQNGSRTASFPQGFVFGVDSSAY